jgi:hypothetical protein
MRLQADKWPLAHPVYAPSTFRSIQLGRSDRPRVLSELLNRLHDGDSHVWRQFIGLIDRCVCTTYPLVNTLVPSRAG